LVDNVLKFGFTHAQGRYEEIASHAKHSAEIEVFKDARNCLNVVMNGRADVLPIKDWCKE